MEFLYGKVRQPHIGTSVLKNSHVGSGTPVVFDFQPEANMSQSSILPGSPAHGNWAIWTRVQGQEYFLNQNRNRRLIIDVMCKCLCIYIYIILWSCIRFVVIGELAAPYKNIFTTSIHTPITAGPAFCRPPHSPLSPWTLEPQTP